MSLSQNKHLLFDSLRHLLIQSKVQKEYLVITSKDILEMLGRKGRFRLCLQRASIDSFNLKKIPHGLLSVINSTILKNQVGSFWLPFLFNGPNKI